MNVALPRRACRGRWRSRSRARSSSRRSRSGAASAANVAAAQQALFHRADCNRAARRGDYDAARRRAARRPERRSEETAMTDSLDQQCINTLRFLSVDMVQKANSGHPGLPLGAAPMAYVLWTRFLKHNPAHPLWPDRDRFVLSAGHGSALLYSLLHVDRLRPVARRHQALPPMGQQGAGPSRARPHGRRRDHDRARSARASPTPSAWRSPRRTSRRATTATATRVVDHRTWVDRQRRRPDGRRRLRSGVARRPPAARQAGLPLRRQLGDALGRHRHDLLRGSRASASRPMAGRRSTSTTATTSTRSTPRSTPRAPRRRGRR